MPQPSQQPVCCWVLVLHLRVTYILCALSDPTCTQHTDTVALPCLSTALFTHSSLQCICLMWCMKQSEGSKHTSERKTVETEAYTNLNMEVHFRRETGPSDAPVLWYRLWWRKLFFFPVLILSLLQDARIRAPYSHRRTILACLHLWASRRTTSLMTRRTDIAGQLGQIEGYIWMCKISI